MTMKKVAIKGSTVDCPDGLATEGQVFPAKPTRLSVLLEVYKFIRQNYSDIKANTVWCATDDSADRSEVVFESHNVRVQLGKIDHERRDTWILYIYGLTKAEFKTLEDGLEAGACIKEGKI